MNGCKKILLMTLLFLSGAFTSLGYAELTTSLHIVGKAHSEPPYAIYITEAVTEGAEGGFGTVNSYADTIANISVKMGNSATSTVTLRVSVFNNTVDYYTFKGVTYNEGEYTYDNANIVFTTSGFNVGNKLGPRQYAHIDVTFTYDEYNGVPEDLNAILDFHFGLSGAEEGTDYESFVFAFLSNEKGYGLNNVGQKGKEVLSNLEEYGLLFADDNIKGGNLKHLVEAVNSTEAEKLTFVFQYESDTKVILYTYEEKFNSSLYVNQSVTVYKTIFLRETVGSESYTEWEVTDSKSGQAMVKNLVTPGGERLDVIDIGTWVAVEPLETADASTSNLQ